MPASKIRFQAETAITQSLKNIQRTALKHLEKKIRDICRAYDMNYHPDLGFYRYVATREEGDQFLSGNWIEWVDDPVDYERLCAWYAELGFPWPQLNIEQNKQNKQNKLII